MSSKKLTAKEMKIVRKHCEENDLIFVGKTIAADGTPVFGYRERDSSE